MDSVVEVNESAPFDAESFVEELPSTCSVVLSGGEPFAGTPSPPSPSVLPDWEAPKAESFAGALPEVCPPVSSDGDSGSGEPTSSGGATPAGSRDRASLPSVAPAATVSLGDSGISAI